MPHKPVFDKCANPSCAKPLRYLRDGRVFVRLCGPECMSLDGNCSTEARQCHPSEFFWLCRECSRKMTLVLDRGQLVIKPRGSGSQKTTATGEQWRAA